ncbi:MAG: hypothetical protein ONB05_05315, partial [candidate division KSB1 bacterium]|nr:hypothetical protein [candidate division KSB1 bacterium]
ALILALFFYLLWGLAFRKMGGLARPTGDFFLVEILFFIWTAVCIALRLQLLANIGILVQTVIIAVAFIMAGLVIFARAGSKVSESYNQGNE